MISCVLYNCRPCHLKIKYKDNLGQTQFNLVIRPIEIHQCRIDLQFNIYLDIKSVLNSSMRLLMEHYLMYDCNVKGKTIRKIVRTATR